MNPAIQTSTRRVLLIGWDAADWKVIDPLIERGEMPHLARFLEEGVMGDLMTLQPVLSPMLWNSIGTGKRADKHGILGFTEVDPRTGGVRPVTSTSRRCKAIWNILSQNGLRTNVINWFGGHPAEAINGVCVSDAIARPTPKPTQPWPMTPGTVHPAELTDELARIRFRPEEVTDELILPFVPRAADVDQENDRRLTSLAKLISECVTTHTIATQVMAKHPWDFMGIYFASIDHFSHGFMNFHPPRLEFVKEEQFELYKDVVNSAYRFHDMMLGTLLHIAGKDATVMLVSDHGFHSDDLRPRGISKVPAGPADQHRDLGIFALKGPGIRQDERIYGASLLDITPTLLHLFNLPIGQDMEGRVLVECFESPGTIVTVPTWEEVDGPQPDGMHLENQGMSPDDSRALLEQFVALGYIDKPEGDQEKAVKTTLREQQWNLARVYMSSGRFEEAVEVLEEICDELPERQDYAQALAQCQWRLGLLDEAEETARSSIRDSRATGQAHWILGLIAYERRRYQDALHHLSKAEGARSRRPYLPYRVGRTHMRLRRWEDAERAFQRSLQIDPHHAPSYQALATCALRQRRFEEAARFALDAVGIHHHLAGAHYTLGVALARLGRYERAIQAFETALSLRTPVQAAHRWLTRLYKRQGEYEKASAHQALLDAWSARVLELAPRREALKAEAQRRSAQRARILAERPRPTEDEPESQEAIQAKRQEAIEQAKAIRESRRADREKGRAEFVVVSGLPRSGTSMMMQMLQAGGLPPMTDSIRTADEDNPQGYFEWEGIKQLRERPELLRDAEGKAIKAVTLILRTLPNYHRYKVIFMDRPVVEVMASQRRMIERKGVSSSKQPDPERMLKTLSEHRAKILERLGQASAFETLVVDYVDLIKNPEPWVERIVAFLGKKLLPQADQMAPAIRPELYRNRGPEIRDITSGPSRES